MAFRKQRIPAEESDCALFSSELLLNFITDVVGSSGNGVPQTEGSISVHTPIPAEVLQFQHKHSNSDRSLKQAGRDQGQSCAVHQRWRSRSGTFVKLEMLLELYPKHWPREDIVVLGVSHVVDFSDNGFMVYTPMCLGNTQHCTSDTFLLYGHPSFEIGEDGKVVQKFFLLGLKAKSASFKALNVEAMLEEISNEFLDPI
ncbi:hypothetical protein ZIOFF_063252 [Zingiber officinale]|uniref:Uncharacterized protein n=1 Tax=Zingiber officinale TaxID=94328 RepID=A0A8J5F1Y1_ZINOF|nr:hypothetical protein ZIOFF_063252 [Zingiber officinale]